MQEAEEKAANLKQIQEAEEKAKAEERKKRLAEQARKKIEDAKAQAEEEKRMLKEEERKRIEQQKKIEESQPVQQIQTIDLLGGLIDEDEPQEYSPFEFQKQWDANDEALSESQIINNSHRSAPQRGPLDAKVDIFFDSVPVNVTVKKIGNIDGVYLFGSRMMKIRIQNDKLIVTLGPKNILPIDQFVSKFERVETIRMKGLNAALNVCTMLGTSSVGQYINV